MEVGGIPIGAWIALSSTLLTAGFAYNGYRSTRVTMLESRISQLEKENERCKADVTRLREDRDFLFEQLRRVRESVRSNQFPSP